MKTQRQTLETAIRETLAPVLAHDPAATFDLYGCELWRDDSGGWSFNDAFRMARGVDLAEALKTARGRWEVFKVNYSPRALVREIDCAGEGFYPGCRSVYVECDHMSFLEIRVNYSAPVNSAPV